MSLKDPEKRRAYHTKYMRERWYPANRAKHIGMVKVSREALVARRKEFVNALKNIPCLDCGGTFPPEAMDFDHIAGKKLGNVSSLQRETSEEKLRAEISKCEVVCSNCHRVRTEARRRGRAAGSPSSS